MDQLQAPTALPDERVPATYLAAGWLGLPHSLSGQRFYNLLGIKTKATCIIWYDIYLLQLDLTLKIPN